MYRRLFDAAVDAALQGTTVITENTRASRQLMSACQQKLRAGRSAWPTPDILPIAAWLQRSWDDCLLSGSTALALLRPVQQRAFWKNIIAGTKTRTLADVAGAVACAQEAWEVLQQYAIELSAAPFQATPETRAFFGWA